MKDFGIQHAWSRGRYRARQFSNLFRARLNDKEWQTIKELLSPPLLTLFRQMPSMDQRHSMDVCAALQAQTCDDPEVLAAALLHDVGKGPIHVGHRVAFVLLEWLAPGLLAWWAVDQPVLWRRAFYLMLHHEEVGAALAAEAGASPAVVTLIRNHEQAGSTGTDTRLALLRAADDAF